MKKILFIFVLALLCSCEKSNEKPHIEYDGKKIEQVNIHQNVPFDQVYEWTYKGHEYIGFDGYRRLGVVHNPDCKKCNL